MQAAMDIRCLQNVGLEHTRRPDSLNYLSARMANRIRRDFAMRGHKEEVMADGDFMFEVREADDPNVTHHAVMTARWRPSTKTVDVKGTRITLPDAPYGSVGVTVMTRAEMFPMLMPDEESSLPSWSDTYRCVGWDDVDRVWVYGPN